jgi:hypothetical protein
MGRTITNILVFGLFFIPWFASAQLIITEILYDLAEGSDTGREWVEVQNTGTESVNLIEWKLFENDTNHGLKAVGGETLSPGAYAIISDNPSKFATDWPSYSGLVFDSAFALNNSGETLVLRCCGKEPTDRDSVTYNNTGGGSGDGLSLHRSGSSLIAAQPSPGSGTVTAPPPPAPKSEPKPEPAPVIQPKVVEPVVQKKQEPALMQTTEQKQETETKVSPLAEPIPPPTVVVQEEMPLAPKKTKKAVVAEPEEVVESESQELVAPQPQPAPISQVATVESMSPSSDVLWWLGAVAISIFGAGGAYIAGRTQRGPKTFRTKDGWQIEESE